MRRYNIFTLGIILTTIYSINVMAAWPTKAATNIWTNSGHTTPAQMRCGDCCKTDCWLPDGTYYDNTGTFTETCGLSCQSGQYDIGFSSCISASTNGGDVGYWEFGGGTDRADTYGLTGPGQWGVTFSEGMVKGIASCNNTNGSRGVATTTEFSNTANGYNCWCKMTSPAASRWVFDYDFNGNAGGCADYCADFCAIDVRSYSDLRSGLFGSAESGGTPPTCDSNRTYSMVNGVCTGKLSCPSGQYDIGFSSCISASTNGSANGYWSFNGSKYSTSTYGLTAGGQWGATLYTGDKVTGIASCNSTNGSYGVATTTEFSNTANGRYCWCKMTSPASSRWVFYYDANNADNCAYYCAIECSNGVAVNSAVRSGVFGSVE